MSEADPIHLDLALVGSGLSATFTVIALLENHPELHVSIALIDPSTEVGGVAYGERSGSTGLTITDLAAFVPEPHFGAFTIWMEENLDELLQAAPPPGAFSTVPSRWYERNEAEIAKRAWGGIQVPRRWFGLYLADRLTDAIGASQATVTRVVASVVRVSETDGSRVLHCSNGETVNARAVVVGVGAGVNRNLWSLSSNGLIDDLYAPSLPDALERIADRVQQDRVTRVLAVGANAASMELIYHLAYADIRELELIVLAPSGQIPFRHPDGTPPTDWQPTDLQRLLDTPDLTVDADSIGAAFAAGVTEGGAAGLSNSQTFDALEKRMLQLLERLSDVERLRFAAHTGLEIGRLQRRAGAEVSMAAQQLMARGALQVVSGRLGEIVEVDDGAYRVSWVGEAESSAEVDVVVNCAGAAVYGQPGACGLTTALLNAGVVQANPSGRGLVVDSSLRAAQDLYVIGPALAGNVIAGQATWHTEHCGRLIAFATNLAETLAKELAA